MEIDFTTDPEATVMVNIHPATEPKVAVIGQTEPHLAVWAAPDCVLHFTDPDVARAWAVSLLGGIDVWTAVRQLGI